MALATQCPHCHTTFRVAHDQLKLRAGSVRCGACQQVFNGIEHLLRPDSPAAVTPAGLTTPHSPGSKPVLPPVVVATKPSDSARRTEVAITRSEQIPSLDFVEKHVEPLHAPTLPANISPPAPTPAPIKQHVAESTDPMPEEDPLQRMTLMDFSVLDEDDEIVGDSEAPAAFTPDSSEEHIVSHEATAPELPPIEASISPSNSTAETGKSPTSEHPFVEPADSIAEEPDFVKRGRRQQRSKRVFRVFTGLACFILLAGLLLQSVYTFRDLISARYPRTTYTLVQSCALIGCEINLLHQIKMISIESDELQRGVENRNTFELIILLRNRSDFSQQWPHIELTLEDSNKKAILRRAFKPSEFSLSAKDLAEGIAGNSEHPLKLTFESLETIPSGYHVNAVFP